MLRATCHVNSSSLPLVSDFSIVAPRCALGMLAVIPVLLFVWSDLSVAYTLYPSCCHLFLALVSCLGV